MKRRHRKPVLDINGDSDSPRRRWPNEYSQNGSQSNPLSTLIVQYNSDNEDDARPRSHALNDQVDDFLKEIQFIALENFNKNNQNYSMQYPGSYWQECYDEQTGYPYYWHMETNQVTWEVPPELKMMQGKCQQEMGAPTPSSHSSHMPPWSSNKYSPSQSNIPDGMIPKEVVARNRNRQAGILNTPAKPPSKTAKSPGYKKDNDIEGKIEMITSFGNESESEESEPEEPPKKLPVSILKKPNPKPSRPLTTYESSSSKSSNSSEPIAPVGPALPPISPMNYGPQNKQSPSTSVLSLSEKLSLTSKRTNTVGNNEEDILTRLKNQAKLFQSSKNGPSNESSKDLDSKNKKLKLSLVPGYEDDSDGGEDEVNSRKVSKPLFPISETASMNDNSNKVAKTIETGSGQIRIYEYRNTEPLSNAIVTSTEDKIEESYGSNENSCDGKVDDAKSEQETKTNKFLESIDAPTKAFQRKRRIAFDVAPTKTKTAEPVKESSPPTEPSEHRGFGYSKDEADALPKQEAKIDTEITQSTTKPRPTMTFVKAAEDDSNGSNSNSSSKEKIKEITEPEKAEMRALTEPIMEKLKFLSEGSPAASAVQVMAIQIQTLMAAWESGSLQETYLRNWLAGTGCELTRLEKAAAPPGWECQWDRSHKRYYYRNSSTGEAQWTYPDADIVGGTEEMELCTTPPPPEHEEPPIIEMSATSVTLSMMCGKPDSKVVEPATSTTDKSGKAPSSIQPPMPEPDAPPPPPPVISSPSPPPPPRIFAEDLKRGHKRKNSPEVSDKKTEDSSKEPKSSSPAVSAPEPLPPGVDPPELAYTLSASALDPSVLYTAQQTNPIYAATLASAAAGIPLLSHHPAHHHPHHAAAAAAAALMPGQLMHYNQAYHHHLHNQAIVARLQDQEAVQFMVAAEYARAYENNQIAIAKPPVKVAHDASLGSAINSFYSDIASIEKSSTVAAQQPADGEKERQLTLSEMIAAAAAANAAASQANDEAGDSAREKKKKKTVLKTGLGKKQKEMSSMVAKWQRAQQNYKD